ncbi:MAG: PQQ-binding-like beta-propeller repeat protein [Verrucomicrobiota bacterium]
MISPINPIAYRRFLQIKPLAPTLRATASARTGALRFLANAWQPAAAVDLLALLRDHAAPRLLLLALSWWVAGPLQGGDNWPQFRGPHANGQSTAHGLPLTFGEAENLLWKVPVHGKAWSSPVVWDQQIWMSTATKDGSELGAVCVDAESGKILHDVVVFKIAKPQFCHPMNSYATPTPMIEKGRIYLHFGTYGSACLDTATAKTLWTSQEFSCDHFRGPASSPIVVDDLLLLTFDGIDVQFLVALDKLTGKTVWKRDRNIVYDTDDHDYWKAYSTPALISVQGHPQLVSPSAGATIAYEPKTGVEIWRVRSGGMNAAALPLFGNGLVYATSATGGYQLFAVRPDGHGDVTDTHVAWQFAKNVPTRSSQILLGERLFMISDAGVISCVDAKTGQSVWQKRLGGPFSASPLFADGRIYFFGEEGAVPVIAAADEYKLLATNQLGDGFMASPAVYNNSLILRSRTHLYRLGKAQ